MSGLSRNPASDMYALYVGAAVAVTAGGAGDATVATSTVIDLTALPDRFEAIAFPIVATTTLAATRSLAVVAKIETSADNATWTDLTAPATALTLASTAGGTVNGGAVVDASLEYALRYVRLSITPDLSAANTDTASILRTAILSGRRKQT
jgi:hypothetical protein